MTAVAEIAAEVHADDVFALSSVEPGRLVNLDGHGRGAGWAGNIHVDPTEVPLLAEALSEGVAAVRGTFPRRVLGPYWARNAVAARAGDGVVVFAGDELGSDDNWTAHAEVVMGLVDEVPMAKRLADELELAQAALEVASIDAGSLDDAAQALAEKAAAALSCEFAAVLLRHPRPSVHSVDHGWQPTATPEELVAAMIPLAREAREDILVDQELSSSTRACPPLTHSDGLVSLAVAPLGPGGSLGTLMVAHSGATPRGFSSLCQQVLRRIAATADPVLQRAIQPARS